MSSEMVGKSNFSVTVSLLSQYIKEKGSLGDLGIGIAAKGKSDTFRPPTTMSLLPGVDVSDAADTKADISDRNAAMELFPQRAGFGPAADGGERKAEKSPSQLTIFYGGKVLVFDNFPAEKAKVLMQFASKGTPAAAPNLGGYVAPAATVSSGFVSAPANPPAAVQRTANVSDLPIARKASLHRFLEKRKDRINAKAPYQVNVSSMSATSVKQEEKQWLGLGPQVGKANLSSELSR